MTRLWHWLTRHEWRVASAVFLPGVQNMNWGNLPTWATISDDVRRIVYGTTEVIETCACGKTRTARYLGDHTALRGAGEIAELERMAR